MYNDFVFIVDKYSTHRYARKGVLNLSYVFPSHPDTAKKYIVRKPKVRCALQRKYSVHDNSVLVRKIFTFFFIRVLEEVIKGEIFNFPGDTGAHILVKAIPDADTKRLRERGYYTNFDLVKARFKIPRITIDFGPFTRRKDYAVYTPLRMTKEMLKRAENGEYQWITIPKTYNKNVGLENDNE